MSLLATSRLGVRIGDLSICHGLDVGFRAGENWAILGANGSGKTTLLHTLAGLRRPDDGQVLLDGQDLGVMARRHLARQRGVLFQDSEAPFASSVRDAVLSGRHPHLTPWQWESTADVRHAEQALAAVDMQSYAERMLTSLSGGERRRVDIAALLTQDAPVCLLDEPLNHLDLHHQVKILDLLRQRSRRPGHVNIMVLHDVNLALRYCDHGLLLFDNGACRHGALASLLDVPTLEQLFGCRFRQLNDADGSVFFPA
jgi:iron complex transport system ATP-binding protein